MKKKSFLYLALFVFIYFSSGNAQNIINVGIGPTWPKDLRDTEKPTAWNATIEYYKLFDNIVGFGLDLDFTWNVFYTIVEVIDTTATPPDTVDRKLDNNRIFMFPISAALLFDPIPKSFIHPVIKGQVGLNMMTKSYEELDTTGQEIKSPKNGFYIGIIGKVSADAVYDLGEHAALFAGFEFQWGKLRHKRSGTVQDYDYFEFYAPCIRMGLSVLY